MKVLQSNQKSIYVWVMATVFSAFGSFAQTVPNPPNPPSTTSVSTSSSTHSVSVENSVDVQNNSSVSVSISDDSYKFRARFDNSKNEGLKTILLKELGNKNLEIDGNTYVWTDQQDGDTIFECKFNKGNLKIHMDKAAVSGNFQEKIVTLGNDLKYYISGTTRHQEDEKKAEKAKRNVEKAERDLEQAKRELERSKREVKRTKEN